MTLPANFPFFTGSPVKTGSWWALADITKEKAALALDSLTRTPVACPNDGTLLDSGVDGGLHCPFDGWRPGMTPPEWVN